MKLPTHCIKQLEKRKANGNLRQLTLVSAETDFSSNDYLGFSKSGAISARLKNHPWIEQEPKFGSGGSRLLSGNSVSIETLEKKIAAFHGFESALFISSGYAANGGLLKSITGRHDVIIYDELSHASIIDGAHDAQAKLTWSFKHNDLDDLVAKIKNARTAGSSADDIFVVTESVFSMDGDFSPLFEISAICQQHDAFLIVDEAHALGLFGKDGNGRVYELGVENQVFASIVTFGKALGCHGAAVLGGAELKEFLVNFCRPFVYSTAPDFHLLAAVDCGYQLLVERSKDVANLFFLIHEFRGVAKKYPQFNILDSLSPIQGIIIPGNDACKRASNALLTAGIDVRPILSPTVPAGLERLRICLHTFNEPPEVQALFYELARLSL